MKQKLLNRKKYSPECSFCQHGKLSADGESVLCVKKGVMMTDSSCRKFVYDPLKRKPKKSPKLTEFEPSEFEI